MNPILESGKLYSGDAWNNWKNVYQWMSENSFAKLNDKSGSETACALASVESAEKSSDASLDLNKAREIGEAAAKTLNDATPNSKIIANAQKIALIEQEIIIAQNPQIANEEPDFASYLAKEEVNFALGYSTLDRAEAYQRIIANDAQGYIGAKRINSAILNDYAKQNQIETIYGKAEVFLDLDGDGAVSLDGVEALAANYEFFNLDSNGDALVDSRDEYFDKLKVRAYDINGKEIVKNLSEVAGQIDLRDFMKSKSDIKSLDIDAYAIFVPEIRYEKITEDDRAKLAKMADKNGWIKFDDLQKLNLAYAKSSADGGVRLQETGKLRGVGDPRNYIWDKTDYAERKYAEFTELYDAYMKELSAKNKFVSNLNSRGNSRYAGDANALRSETMLRLESRFREMTGKEFSLSNLNMVKDSFENDKTATANMMKDSDILYAMRLNANGSFTLRFSSGREITVRELYKDSGSIFEAGVSLNLDAETMSDEELNELDFATIGVKYADPANAHAEKLATLKELGVKAIKTLSKGNVDYLLLTLENGKELQTRKEFFNILKKSGKQAANIDPKERFYPRPVSILA